MQYQQQWGKDGQTYQYRQGQTGRHPYRTQVGQVHHAVYTGRQAENVYILLIRKISKSTKTTVRTALELTTFGGMTTLQMSVSNPLQRAWWICRRDPTLSLSSPNYSCRQMTTAVHTTQGVHYLVFNSFRFVVNIIHVAKTYLHHGLNLNIVCWENNTWNWQLCNCLPGFV